MTLPTDHPTRADHPPGDIHAIFIGPQGLRAGWGIALFVAIVAALSAALRLIMHAILHVPAPDFKNLILTPGMVLRREGVIIAVLLIAMAVLARIEKRSIWSYGLAGADHARNFAVGAAGGFMCLSALIGVLYATGTIAFDGVALDAASAAFYGTAWFAAFFCVGLAEEVMTRGYLQSTLTRGLGFWPASIMTSMLFAMFHLGNAGEDGIGIAQVFVAGMVLCLLLRKTGSLWLGIGFHAAWDWAQSFFYGTADSGYAAQFHLLVTHPVGNVQLSGGSVGPEGSLLATPIMVLGLLGLLGICHLMPRRPAPMLVEAVL